MKINQFVLKFIWNICFQILLSGMLLLPEMGIAQVNVTVWVVPSEQKVRPDDPVETNNLVWSKEDKRINVAGARNQHVSFQVVVTTPLPEGYKNLNNMVDLEKTPGGFFIEASGLTSKQGKMISKEQIKFYLEHYIMLYGKSSPIGNTGYWPDALAPLKVPFSMEASYSVVKNRPIWVDIPIPPGTPGGLYTGTITITQNGKSLESLNVEVKVYSFSLPDKTHLITYMNIDKEYLANFYHKPESSEEIDQLTQTYYKFLYEHRMEPWINEQLEPEIAVNDEKVTVKFNDARCKYYMDSLNTNRVLLNAYPSSLKSQITAKQFSKSFNQKVESYLSQVKSYFEKNGWKDRLVFISPIDEPDSKEDYEDTRKWANLVHEAAPGIPFLATKSPVTSEGFNYPLSKKFLEWGTLRGYVNDFAIFGNDLNDPEVKQAINEEQSKGGEITWYPTCGLRYPQPNYFIDAPALDPVMIPWITARYHMNGILYWALNFWTETPNPWRSAVTFIPGFVCSDGYILNGEGSLLYPGDYTKRYTRQPDVDGPVSSIRFELLREGIQDYEYLWMLKNLGARDFAESQIQRLVIDVSTFSRNLEELYLTRKAMAQRLEELTH